jgi:hypothetical protein
LYKRAIELGNERAMCELGLLYLTGFAGLKKKSKKAIDLLDKSAQKNYQKSVLKLAKLYREGNTEIPQDIDLSAKYFFQSFKLEVEENPLFKFRQSSFHNILENKFLTWKTDFHIYWPKEENLDKTLILLLLISKFRESLSINFLVKGICFIIIKHLCHFCQKKFGFD